MQKAQIDRFRRSSVKHAQESMKLYFNRKKLQFYTHRDFRSTDTTAYDAAFFNICFLSFAVCKKSKDVIDSLACL